MPKNELDEFLGDLNSTVDDSVFENKQEEIEGFGETPVENNEKAPESKPEPFHKNPKIKRFIEKEISKALESQGKTEQPIVKAPAQEDDELSSVIARMIGNDTTEKELIGRDLKKVLLGIKNEAREEALQSFKQESQQAEQAQRDAERVLNESFEAIEETYGVDITSNAPLAKKTRSEFISFVQRLAPKNSNGEITEYPDFIETFDVFQETKKATPAPSNARAKDIASRSMARSTETQSAKPTEKMTWDTVSRIFDKLGS